MAHGCFARLKWLHSIVFFAIFIASLVGISSIYDGYGYRYGLGHGSGHASGGGYGSGGYFSFSSLQIIFSEQATPSTAALTGALLASSQLVAGSGLAPKSCPADGEFSCQNSTQVEDTCCFNAPGGLMLLTEFWDAEPAQGPEDSWTIHGLWPDNCDGSYEQFCDKGREYSNITDILKSLGKDEVLNDMTTYWKDNKGDDESFWEHEWNKHGTCISTLETECYEDYKPQAEVGDYFEKAVNIFKGIGTYKTLADAGIVPDSSKTYKLSDIQAALSAKHGKDVHINCRSGALNELWYFYNIKGNLVDGEYAAADPAGASSKCPDDGIKYLPKGDGGSPSPTEDPTSSPTETDNPPKPTETGVFSGKGYLQVTTGGKEVGCLISSGKWFTSGTCATYTASGAGEGFSLSSSKGECGIANDVFTCSSAVDATTFSADGGKLAIDGKSTFYADEVASGSKQVPISTSKKGTELTVSWKSA